MGSYSAPQTVRGREDITLPEEKTREQPPMVHDAEVMLAVNPNPDTSQGEQRPNPMTSKLAQ